MRGAILSSTPIGTGRVVVDTFQIPTGYPEPPAPLQNNGRVEYGAFASTASRGAVWSGGVGWTGRYLLFVTDTATGRKITANVDIGPNAIPTIDLDAICFGFDTCVYNAGGPGVTAGSFHPTSPTRILDTRKALGFWSPVPSGDGRNSSPDPITRRDETATTISRSPDATGSRQRRVGGAAERHRGQRRRSRAGLHVRRSRSRPGSVTSSTTRTPTATFPSTSNLNIDNGDPVPNLVLARVGAGGKIRIANYLGPTHVIADVAGWFGTGGAYTDGAGFAGVVPDRAVGQPQRDRWSGATVRRRRDPLRAGRRCRRCSARRRRASWSTSP